MMVDDRIARTMLRPLVPCADRGSPVGKHMEDVFRAALAYQNFSLSKTAQHFHAFFTRPKSDGVSVRLIVDGTAGGHPNAINQRLPRPPPPPAMMRVPTVVLVLVTGTVFGVDDVQTAFPTMRMCRTMTQAHGVAVILAGGGILRAVTDRVIQGGTWSATVCQYAVLQYALGSAGGPRRETADIMRPDEVLRRRQGVPYARICLRMRRLVHVDDVMSGGTDAAQLDRERLEFRARATALYGVRWKAFKESAPRGRAVGIEVDCEQKTWGVCYDWGERVCESLGDVRTAQWTDDVADWFNGVAAWVSLVLHVPMVPIWLVREDRASAVDVLVMMIRSRARYRQLKSVEQTLRAWPRDGQDAYSISDASRRGWAAARTDGASRCGIWKWCARVDAPTTVQCCDGREAVEVESKDIYKAEALASMEMLWDWRRDEDTLLVSDSQIWVNDVRKGHSMDTLLGGLLAAFYLVARGPWAVAHVAGHGPGSNYADGPSQSVQTFSVSGLAPPSSMRVVQWAKMGVATCSSTLDNALARAILPYLPCVWRTRLAEVCAIGAAQAHAQRRT